MGGIFTLTQNYIEKALVLEFLEEPNPDDETISYFCSHPNVSKEILNVVNYSKCINFSKFNYGDSLISYFTKIHPDLLSRLTYLNLNGNNLTVNSMVMLTNCPHFSNVITLDLSCNNLTTELNSHIMTLFLKFPRLKILDVGSNNINKVNFSFYAKSLLNVGLVILKGNNIDFKTSCFGLLPNYKVLFKDVRLLSLKKHLLHEIFEFSKGYNRIEIYSKFKNKKFWSLIRDYRKRTGRVKNNLLVKQTTKRYAKEIESIKQYTEICEIVVSECVWSLITAKVQNRILVIAGMQSGIIEVYDTSLRHIHSLEQRRGSSVNAFEVLNDGILASGSSDSTIRLWDLNTFKSNGELRFHTKCVNDLKVIHLNDMECLISGGWDFKIAVWNVKEKKVAFTLSSEGSLHSSIAYQGSTSNILYTGGSNKGNKIYKWNLMSEKVTQVSNKGHISSVTSLEAYELENRVHLASACVDGEVKIWDATTLEILYVLAGFPKAIIQLTTFKSGKKAYLAIAAWQINTSVWDLSAGDSNRPVTFLELIPKQVNAITIINLEITNVLVVGGNNGSIILWKM